MTPANLLEFISQYCKKEDHSGCCGSWDGLGFKVLCGCICHRHKSIEEQEEEEIKT